MSDVDRHIQLEVPRFGEFARQYAAVRSRDLAICLDRQQRSGQRIGRLLIQAGLITSTQLVDILGRQARWAARMRSQEIAPRQFPISTPISLCMPCYNESHVLDEVLTGALAVLPEFASEFELIVVDDGSTDDTAAIVERHAAKNDSIRLVRHPVNRGYGAAVTSGLRAAHGDWICFTDGDGQFNLLDLPQLLLEAQSSDVVIGYRHRRADNRARRFNAQGWKWLIRALIGLRVRDLDCAFKLFPRWVIDRLQLTADGACISAEILAQCVRGGASICEVPVNHFPRAAGKATGANLTVVLKALRELPIVWKYRSMQPWDNERLSLGPRDLVAAAKREQDLAEAVCNEREFSDRIDAQFAPAVEG